MFPKIVVGAGYRKSLLCYFVKRLQVPLAELVVTGLEAKGPGEVSQIA